MSRPTLRIKFMSDADIRSASNGAVQSYRLYNFKYKVPRPVPDGLFCEKIFGPIQDYTCACGTRHSLVKKVCPTCGVPIIHSRERRNRMGHIETFLPYINPISAKLLATVIGISDKALLEIATGALRYILEPNSAGKLICEDGTKYFVRCIQKKDPEWESSEYSIYSLLSDFTDLGIDSEETVSRCKDTGVQRYRAAGYTTLRSFCNTTIMVSPPLHRDISISNGEIAYHPTNVLYLRILRIAMRFQVVAESDNDQLFSILRDEARVLQHMVNSIYTEGAKDARENDIPSVLDKLGGKEGLFRGNMLGKRADYSGRSVVTAGPHLPLDTADVPWKMMYTLLEPEILGHLVLDIEREFAEYDGEETASFNPYTIAHRMYRKKHPQAVELCFELSKRAIIILNRAPSLHRYSVGGFKVRVHDGKSIKIPPMICAMFNADHDGDTMAVHLVVSEQGRQEFDYYRISSNLMSSIDMNSPNMAPSHEAVVGLYQLTM